MGNSSHGEEKPIQTRMKTTMALLDVQVRLQSIETHQKQQPEDTMQLTETYRAPLAAAPIKTDMLNKLEMCTATLSDEINKLVAMQKPPLNAFVNAFKGGQP